MMLFRNNDHQLSLGTSILIDSDQPVEGSWMELYQLKTFKMVAEEEHLTRAAKRLNASQPAVSSHIKALE